jgi:hypothetical protein
MNTSISPALINPDFTLSIKTTVRFTVGPGVEPHDVKTSPTTAAKAIIPNNLMTFFIKDSFFHASLGIYAGQAITKIARLYRRKYVNDILGTSKNPGWVFRGSL